MNNRDLDIEACMKRHGAQNDIDKPRSGSWVKYSPHSLLGEPTLRPHPVAALQALPPAAAHAGGQGASGCGVWERLVMPGGGRVLQWRRGTSISMADRMAAGLHRQQLCGGRSSCGKLAKKDRYTLQEDVEGPGVSRTGGAAVGTALLF